MFLLLKKYLFIFSSTLLLLVACVPKNIQKPFSTPAILNTPIFIYIENFNTKDIQAAADSLKESGGIIVLPEGEFLVRGVIRLFGGVSIVGQGIDKTILYRGDVVPNDPTKGIIEINGANGGSVRIQGISFIGFTTENDYPDVAIKLNNVQDFRVTFCYFEKFGSSGVVVNNTSWGVIDRCVFRNIYKKEIGNLGYGVSVYGGESWNDVIKPGAKYATFIEDCDFYGCRHAIASNKSARYVFRHNYVAENIVSHSVDAHGPGFNSTIGTQWAEIYNNLIEKHPENREAIMIRGGSAVIFNNIVRNHRQAIVLTLDFDKKLDWTGPYPLPWQVHDTWCWNNTLDGKPANVFVPKRSENYIQENRDYFIKPKPDYVAYPYPHPLRNEKIWSGFEIFNPY